MTTYGEAKLDAQRDREAAALEGAWLCPYCEWRNAEDAHDCYQCGAWHCENCGHRVDVEKSEQRCPECGWER